MPKNADWCTPRGRSHRARTLFVYTHASDEPCVASRAFFVELKTFEIAPRDPPFCSGLQHLNTRTLAAKCLKPLSK